MEATDDSQRTSFCVTLDTDWVPPFMLEYVLDMLRKHNVPATVFCTSPYALKESPLLEVALHPNFMADSTQGDSEEARLAYVQTLYPHAVGCRAHRYYWHSGMYALLARQGLLYDSSLLLPFQAHLKPAGIWASPAFPSGAATTC